MKKITLLDCTLRDGGYVNDWKFGEPAIRGICKKMAQTGVEICEVGFIKGDTFDPNRAVFPNTACIADLIAPKDDKMLYVGMVDMSAPVPLDRIAPCDGSSIDGIRVIFKKEKIDEGYKYVKYAKEQGYKTFVQFVGTDMYSDKEFIEGIEKFNELEPDAMSIVDSFGLIKKKQFLRLVHLADNNMKPNIALGYHSHNNLQQAFGNSEALVEMNLNRDICIDGCVFGMGRGAGNLNLELFAEYMNENYGTSYRVEPMLEIMDEYLTEIYNTKFWGYSLPLYLSASLGCHPNYAIHLAERGTLTVKAFSELLKSIPDDDKAKFSKDKAEKYYREYMEIFLDDRDALAALGNALLGKHIVVIAPGKSIAEHAETVKAELQKPDTAVIALNFDGGQYKADYIFSSNMRRFAKIQDNTDVPCIITSNMKEAKKADFVVNFSSYASDKADIIDNSGVMLLKLLQAIGIKEAAVAGMDGYSPDSGNVYFDKTLEHDFSSQAETRNRLIAGELKDIEKTMKLRFITPTYYEM